ncbi:MAG: hypothetical protein M1820_006825 [Bogoriella megaspora]|nr:MAG: hypothetical protein M1820_006825 [Bogoriella megaspora]
MSNSVTDGLRAPKVQPRAAILLRILDTQLMSSEQPFSASTSSRVSEQLLVEEVPDATKAFENFIKAAEAWRSIGGTVMHVHTCYTPEQPPGGCMLDFAPRAGEVLSEGVLATAFYDGLIQSEDKIVRKTNFSAVTSSNLSEVLRDKGYGTVIIGGLTTPICVGTTVDNLSMSGIKVIILEDACASQSIGSRSVQDAHTFAIERMRFLFAQVTSSSESIASLKLA